VAHTAVAASAVAHIAVAAQAVVAHVEVAADNELEDGCEI
jgi:hypothetical protein